MILTSDLGDGTYRTPVLNADWSDPDLLRVGDDFYLTASSFGRAPGLPLPHSRDLVNWRLVGHALPRLEPAHEFRTPRHDCGVWAPSLRHHYGWLWISAPAGGVQTGWQGAFRSPGFFGPYEERIVLEQGDTDVDGPHQGGWVRTPAGEDWFAHFQARGAYGRVVHLQLMRRGSDGWPVIGNEGVPVAVHRKPDLPRQPPSAPATDDDFPGGRFGRQWQWTANPLPSSRLRSSRGDPHDGWATQLSGDGLRLTCVRTADAHDLRKLPNVLTQRLPGAPATVEVELRLDSEEPGARAGLAVLGDAFSWIGLQRGRDGSVQLVHRFDESVAMGHPPHLRAVGEGAGRRARAARARRAGPAVDRDRQGSALPLLVRHRGRPSALRPGLRRHPLALGRRPDRARRARARRRGPRRRGHVHPVPRHRRRLRLPLCPRLHLGLKSPHRSPVGSRNVAPP